MLLLFLVFYRCCSIGVFSAQFPFTVENQVQNVDVSEAAAAAAETSEFNVAEKEPQTAAATATLEVDAAENEPQTAASEVGVAENEPQTLSASCSASSETEEDEDFAENEQFSGLSRSLSETEEDDLKRI
jgi:hypothetical protein